MCDKGYSNEASAIELKQEPGVKVEPHPEDELDEFPVFRNRGGQTFIDLSQWNSVSDNSSGDEVKIEVKDETDKKKEKKMESNVANANNGAINNQLAQCVAGGYAQNSQLKRNVTNTKKQTGINARQKGLKHQCGLCEYATKYKSNLNRHLLTHTGIKLFPCERCTKAFTSQRELKNHMKFHVKEFLFSCSKCLKGFNQKNDKMAHESKCKTLRYECHLCKHSCGPIKTKLIQHMCVHSGQKSFQCDECRMQSTTQSNLKRHIMIHGGPRSFRCSKCHQRFLQKGEMVAHEQRCNRSTFVCYACGMFIGLQKGRLDKHMRTHTGDKPFKCTQCQKKFAQKHHLSRHMTIHTRSLPWKCSICHQGFSKQSQWKAHQQNCNRCCYECFLCRKFIGSIIGYLKQHMTKHSGEKPFQCKMCRKRFTQKGNLKRHMKSIHGKPFN